MNFDVKFGMEYRGDGSVQADWAQNDPNAKDYVKNRPGGYDIMIPAKEITWDGNIEGRTVVDTGEIAYINDTVVNTVCRTTQAHLHSMCIYAVFISKAIQHNQNLTKG